MTTAHTATPFIVKGREVLCETTGHTICEVPYRDMLRANNDAEFIVRACNAHDDLVTALKNLLDAVDGKRVTVGDCYQASAALGKAGAA